MQEPEWEFSPPAMKEKHDNAFCRCLQTGPILWADS